MPEYIDKQLTYLQKQINNLIKPEIPTISELDLLYLQIVNNLSDVADALTSFDNIKQSASTIYEGVSELATDAEAQAMTDTSRVLTPSNLAAIGLALPVHGRLTLTTATPVLTSNVTTATTIYFTPYLGDRISLYTGSFWKPYIFTEISIAVPSTIYRLFDIYIYDNSGTITLEVVNWNQSTAAITGATNATPIVITSNGHGLSNNDLVGILNVGGNTAANGIWSVANVAANTFELEGSTGSGAYTAATGTWYRLNETRATALATQNGKLVKSGDTGKLYLGTCMTTATSGQTEMAFTGSPNNFLLWNYYNRIQTRFGISDTTSHTYTSATARIYRNVNTNKVGLVVGVQESSLSVILMGDFNFDAGDGAVTTGMSLNRTGVVLTLETRVGDVFNSRYLADGGGSLPAAGYNFMQLVQSGAATSPDFQRAVLRGTIFI